MTKLFLFFFFFEKQKNLRTFQKSDIRFQELGVLLKVLFDEKPQ